MSKTRKLTFSGLVIAIYVIAMYFTQSFAFGQYQIRIATGLYALAYHFPFLVIPLGISNLISNIIMGGFGLYDAIGGCLVGIITSGSIVLLKRITKNNLILLLPIGILPSILVPIWLSFLIHVPYWILVISISVGQFVSAYTLGLFIMKVTYFNKVK